VHGFYILLPGYINQQYLLQELQEYIDIILTDRPVLFKITEYTSSEQVYCTAFFFSFFLMAKGRKRTRMEPRLMLIPIM